MKLATDLIRPLLFKGNAFDQAREFYRQFENHPDPKKRLCFEDDLLDYLRFGFVKSSPTAFAMAKAVNVAPEETDLVEMGWFIRFAIGPMFEVLTMLPFYLPKIVFCRRNTGPLRIYETKRLYKIAAATMKRGKATL